MKFKLYDQVTDGKRRFVIVGTPPHHQIVMCGENTQCYSYAPSDTYSSTVSFRTNPQFHMIPEDFEKKFKIWKSDDFWKLHDE
jgi:hypothetical protein